MMEDDFFGMLGKTLTGFFQNIFFNMGNLGKISGHKKRIKKSVREIDKLYERIGRTLYEKHREGEIKLLDDEISLMVDEIERQNRKVEESRKMIKELSKTD